MDWPTIVRTEGPMAFDTAWRILGRVADAEDAVQAALLDAFEAHQRESISNWGGFLRCLATRRAIDQLRKRRPTEALEQEPTARQSDQPDAAAIARDLARRLRAAVAQLPDREAAVFSLRYFGEMTNSEVAASLEISTDAVGVALHKARKKLKRQLGLGDTQQGSSPNDVRSQP